MSDIGPLAIGAKRFALTSVGSSDLEATAGFLDGPRQCWQGDVHRVDDLHHRRPGGRAFGRAVATCGSPLGAGCHSVALHLGNGQAIVM